MFHKEISLKSTRPFISKRFTKILVNKSALPSMLEAGMTKTILLSASHGNATLTFKSTQKLNQQRTTPFHRGIAHPISTHRPIITRTMYASTEENELESPERKPTRWQRLGQSLNVAGISFFVKVALTDRSLAVPHLEVATLEDVKWAHLHAAGFQGIIFDKDNTLTEPYKLTLQPSAAAALKECQSIFNGRIVLYSNSAGLEQFDPEGAEAASLETALGIPVLRHKEKKPAGGSEDIEKHFGCSIDKIIMVGDRYLTDIAFGNRLGMFTIRPQPFTSIGEPKSVRAARAVEELFVGRCRQSGIESPDHALVPDREALKNYIVETP